MLACRKTIPTRIPTARQSHSNISTLATTVNVAELGSLYYTISVEYVPQGKESRPKGTGPQPESPVLPAPAFCHRTAPAAPTGFPSSPFSAPCARSTPRPLTSGPTVVPAHTPSVALHPPELPPFVLSAAAVDAHQLLHTLVPIRLQELLLVDLHASLLVPVQAVS